jgi:hypothetical protein
MAGVVSGVHKCSKNLEATSKFYAKLNTEDPQIGAGLQNSVSTATWRQGFLYRWVTEPEQAIQAAGG